MTCTHCFSHRNQQFPLQFFFVPAASCRGWRDYLLHLNLNTSTQPHAGSMIQNKSWHHFLWKAMSKNISTSSVNENISKTTCWQAFSWWKHWREISLPNTTWKSIRTWAMRKKLMTSSSLVFLGIPSIGSCWISVAPYSPYIQGSKTIPYNNPKRRFYAHMKDGPENPL